MGTATIHTAKTTLSKLLARVEASEQIVLARGKMPIAKLVPYQPAAPKRQLGSHRGVVSVGSAFFEPLPDEELDSGRTPVNQSAQSERRRLPWIEAYPPVCLFTIA